MDVLGKFPARFAAGALILLMAGCSSAPTKTESAPPKSVYNAPKTAIQPAPKPAPVVAAPVATKATTPAKTTTQVSTAPKPQSTVQPAKAPVKPVPAQPVAKPAPIKPAPAASPIPASASTTAGKPAATPPKVETPAAATVALLDATQSPKPPAENLKVTLDNLPLNIHGEWTLDRNESRCLLKSTPSKMDDGQGGTSVTLLIEPGSFLVKTESDIDLTYKNTGLQIDGQSPFALETVDARTNVRFTKQRQAILSSMQSGNDLRLTLGFWPTWPVTHTYSTNIPLTHFATAIKAWDTCNRLLNRN